ncbi:flagellar type III secretion system pore protein FliP [Abyssisolibacter fermentans]|uniref:flagellar type III secretion system pore protein FliP n=1 Tax=Abyssisolibacter fermentans TaxID=1766203 RepID=UPI000830DB83|nr:flagellar type III secretion system pore protein FliP [Abyssisolibacter fermentans]
MKKRTLIIFLTITLLLLLNSIAFGESEISALGKRIVISDTNDTSGYVTGIKIMILLTILSFAPAILLTMTCFTRIIIVLHFIRTALGTQQTPPNKVLIGLALFLTFFIMSPVITDINDNAVKPYMDNEITEDEAMEKAIDPIRDYMLNYTRDKDLALFIDIANIETVNNIDDIPIRALIPAYIISELKTAFQIGFLIFIPFLVIDMVVASTLMSMGMMMLPPVMISLPFKILLFVMVDGWNIIIKSLILGFK